MQHANPLLKNVDQENKFITIGEIISCGILGMLLLKTLEKYRNELFTK